MEADRKMDAVAIEEREKATATAGMEEMTETVRIQATQIETPAEVRNSNH